MSTIPTGAPAWLRTNDFVTYGGDPNKKNFQSRGVINPKTDVGAEGFSRLVADVAAVARVVEFCSMQVICDVSVHEPLVENCRLMTGATLTYFGSSPLPGFPTVTGNAAGDVTITFSSAYEDEYGVTGALVIADPFASLIGATPGVATPEPVTDTEVRIRCVNLSGVAISGARFSFSVGSS